jgi:hypothetical protein
MVSLEQVEDLRKRANVSYEEAKKALEEADGDILEAIIILERQNKIDPPEGGGYYSTKDNAKEQESYEKSSTKKEYDDKEVNISIGDLLKKLGNFALKLIEKGNRNYFEVVRNGERVMKLPVTVLAILALFMFWIVFPLIIVGLFFGFRYGFSGPDLGREDINRAMDSMAGFAENIKKEVKGENSNGENTDNRR